MGNHNSTRDRPIKLVGGISTGANTMASGASSNALAFTPSRCNRAIANRLCGIMGTLSAGRGNRSQGMVGGVIVIMGPISTVNMRFQGAVRATGKR